MNVHNIIKNFLLIIDNIKVYRHILVGYKKVCKLIGIAGSKTFCKYNALEILNIKELMI